MASANTLCKKLLNVKNIVVEDCGLQEDADGMSHLRIRVRPKARHQDDCPVCHKRCPRYDCQTAHWDRRKRQIKIGKHAYPTVPYRRRPQDISGTTAHCYRFV